MIPVVVHQAKSTGEAAQVDLVKVLKDMGATSAPSARPWTARGPLEEQALASLLRAGVVQQESGGRYWVSESALEMRRASQSTAALMAVLIGVLVAAVAVGLAILLKR